MRPILTLALFAAMPALAAPAAAQMAALPLDQQGTLLDVTAQGKTARVPDLATIEAGVTTQAATAAGALADNAAQMDKVIAALKAAGVADRDIATTTVRLNPQYQNGDNQPPTISGYQATNTVSVRFRDVAKSGAILDTLVRQGANQIDGPNLSLSEPDAALDEARTDAVRKARARAELYAKAAGLSVARIVSISENGEDDGGQPPRPVMFAARSAAMPKTQIAAGETDVTVTVAVRFLLK